MSKWGERAKLKWFISCYLQVDGQWTIVGEKGRHERSIRNDGCRTSLVAQWLRIHLPMQETRVRALVWEDPTCRGATKPMRHNYWACSLERVSHKYWSPCTLSLCSATREATATRSPHSATKSSPHSPQVEKAHAQQQRSNADKKKKGNDGCTALTQCVTPGWSS